MANIVPVSVDQESPFSNYASQSQWRRIAAVEALALVGQLEFQVPPGQNWFVSLITCQFGTSSVVGQRRLAVVVLDAAGTFTVSGFPAGVEQPEDATFNYAFAPGITSSTTPLLGHVDVAIPALPIPSGDRFQLFEVNEIDPLDDFVAVKVFYEVEPA